MTHDNTAARQMLEQEAYRELHPTLSALAALPGGGGAQEQRSTALARLAAMGMPTIKLEDWKYTDLLPWLARDYNAAQPGEEAETHTALYTAGEALVFSFSNGYLTAFPRALPEGITIMPLAEALQQEEWSTRYAETLSSDFNGMVAANTAYATQGLAIKIEKGAEINTPVYIHNHIGGAGSLQHFRILIEAEAGSRATFVQHFSGQGHRAGHSLLNMVTEVNQAPRTHITISNIQDLPQTVAMVQTTAIALQEYAYHRHTALCLNGALLRNDLNFDILGSGVDAHLNGLYMPGGRQLIDNHSLVRHIAPRSISNELYKGLMLGDGKAVFNGKIYVGHGASGTNAYQSNKNVLLSDRARINTKPQLEIFTDDVKCSHGATTGQMSEEALFYLRARGIGELEAAAMLSQAFAEEVSMTLPDEKLRHFAAERIARKMEEAAAAD